MNVFSPRGLLAVDLDGTLVRADGVVEPRDRDALASARRRGVCVTLATGRLAPTTVAIARELDLEAPLICADGAALVCPQRGLVLARRSLGLCAVGALLASIASAGLAPFVCFAEEIVGGLSIAPLAPWLLGYAPSVASSSRLADLAVERADEVVMLLGLGPRERVEVVRPASLPGIAITSFGLGHDGPWALRALRHDAGKGAALARLAARLGVPRERVAAVGDWYNDISMLAWAGRSFAMGGSPPSVQRAAGATLGAPAGCGGGVAEAVERWLDLDEA